MERSSAQLVASIMNSAWMVRHYARGYRTSINRDQRKEAIRALGLTVRDAFNQCEDFEPLLAAVCDGLRPRDEQPF